MSYQIQVPWTLLKKIPHSCLIQKIKGARQGTNNGTQKGTDSGPKQLPCCLETNSFPVRCTGPRTSPYQQT